MSYNVWFGDVKMEERMEAIGHLVKQYSPDIIFFRRSLQISMNFLRVQGGGVLNEPSVLLTDAKTRIYFCMLLSKLRVKNFMSKPFVKSSMGRELCAAEIDVGSNKTLVIATSHLESLSPNSEKWVSQAEEALRFLEQFSNVIFGGDMNWD
ncbi:hypothetical protein J5N97_025823 [Dioscorea zingiberensis]|uniref:Endonuclease/exonuclease/phosphatase domain-containing protein n=1 Tax=Dioscorea zingiberensis TaxID=325984 RepID=A0A9D5C190_9LILI|nr:hypothetical protein J5N97_025823 [Dioscorea zingiberensis]